MINLRKALNLDKNDPASEEDRMKSAYKQSLKMLLLYGMLAANKWLVKQGRVLMHWIVGLRPVYGLFWKIVVTIWLMFWLKLQK